MAMNDEAWEAMKERVSGGTRRKPREEEHRLQSACVTWFDAQYAGERMLLFAVPNGGRRDKVTGAKMKAEGVRAGVADLFYARARWAKVRKFENGMEYYRREMVHGLFIEMKTKERGSGQSEAQKAFEAAVVAQGYSYAVCRSLEEFIRIVEGYRKSD